MKRVYCLLLLFLGNAFAAESQYSFVSNVTPPIPGGLDLPIPVFVPVLGTPVAMGSVGLEDVVIGDFDCDGLADVSAPTYNGRVAIAYRSGDRFLASFVRTGTTFLRGAATGDFNQDGCDDLAAVDSGAGYTVMLLGQSNGLASAVGSPRATPNVPWGVDVADFNADGLDDVVSADASTDLAYIFLASTGGSFSATSTFALGRNSIHVKVGDFDHNGAPDIFSTNHNAATATILLNNGAGSFIPAPSSPLSVVDRPCRPMTADFNADGNMDIMLRSGERYQMAFYAGNGVGGFLQGTILDSDLPFGCSQFAAADLDGNGKLDLAVPFGDRIRFYYQRANGTFLKQTSQPFSGITFKGLSAFDFDSNGTVEIAASARRSEEALVLVLGPVLGPVLFASGFE